MWGEAIKEHLEAIVHDESLPKLYFERNMRVITLEKTK